MKWLAMLLISLLGSAFVYRIFFSGSDAAVQAVALEEMRKELNYQREG